VLPGVGWGGGGWLQAASTAAQTCSAEEPLATKALAPAWRAMTPIPAPSAEENTATWTMGSWLRIRAVACTPSSRGRADTRRESGYT
jgi:hypothetical protein